MIRDEVEYREAVKRLADGRQRVAEHRALLLQSGLSTREMKLVFDPLESFHLAMQKELDRFSAVKEALRTTSY